MSFYIHRHAVCIVWLCCVQESDRGTKVLAAFTIDLKEYAKPIDVGTNRSVLFCHCLTSFKSAL